MKTHRAPTNDTQSSTDSTTSNSNLPEQDRYGNSALSSWMPTYTEEADHSGSLFGEMDPMGLGFGGFGGDSIEMLAANIGSIEALETLSGSIGSALFEQLIAYLAEHRRDFIISLWATSPYNPLIALIAPKISAEILATHLLQSPPEQIAHMMNGLDSAGLGWYAVPVLLALGAGLATVLPLLKSSLLEALWERSPETMRQRACEALAEHWPAGLGFDFTCGLGATFGIPLHLGYDHASTVCHVGNGDIKVSRRGVVDLSLDTGAGAAAYVNDYQAGFGLAAELQAGGAFALEQDFHFPTQDNDAFLAFLKYTARAGSYGPAGLVARFAEAAEAVDPKQYLTRTRIERTGRLDGQLQGNLGVRTGLDEDRTATWSREEGAPEMGQKSDPSLGRVGSTLDWLARSFIECTLDGDAHLAQSIGLEIRQPSPEHPEQYTVELFAEGAVAEQLTQKLPDLLQFLSLPTPPAFNGGLGICSTWNATWPHNETKPTIGTLSNVSLYGTQTEPDALGALTTTNKNTLGLDMAPDTFVSIEHFLDSVVFTTSVSRRVHLTAPLGQKFLSAAKKQASFRTLLPEQYLAQGVTVDGYVDLTSSLTADMLRNIFSAVLAGSSPYTEPGGLQQLYQDMLVFLSTGQAPPILLKQLENIVNAFLSGLTTANLHARLSAGVAGGASIAEGAKISAAFNLGAGVTFDYDLLTDDTGAHIDLTVSDMKRLFSHQD